MKHSRRLATISLLVALLLALSLTGCGEEKSGNTIVEPEITAQYLAEDYAQQLLADGAETMLGTVSMEKEDDAYQVHITEREVIPNANYDEGYYIADTNLSKDAVLGFDARIACLHDGELVVETADDFIKNHPADSEQLYTVYLMGDSAELILATDPAEVEVEE